MSSPAIIDISALMLPISEENPVGEDVRLDSSPTSMYSEIKGARNSARAAERSNMFDGDSSEALEHWNKIISLAPKILSAETKDLEIACWYTEALIRKAGFQGLRDGFTLIGQFIEQFWDNDIYPTPDEDGIETRVAPIAGLNGEGADGVLLAPIRSAHITEDVDPGPFSLWQYKQAVDIKRISDDDKRAAQINSVGFSMENIESVVEQSSNEYYADLHDDVSECLTQFKKFSDLLNEHCGSQDAPSTSKITELLEDTLGAINHIAKHKLPVETIAEVSDDEAQTEETQTTTSGTAIGAALNSRAEAFKQLNTIAEYFRKTEPHSPISYILSKAGKWGDMSLEELMNELIPDSSARGVYSSLTGVQQNDND